MKRETDGRYKGKNMDLVQAQFAKGIQDRDEIAKATGLTRSQVGYAVRNLQARGRIEQASPPIGLGRGKGQTDAEFRVPVKKQWGSINSVFALGSL